MHDTEFIELSGKQLLRTSHNWDTQHLRGTHASKLRVIQRVQWNKANKANKANDE